MVRRRASIIQCGERSDKEWRNLGIGRADKRSRHGIKDRVTGSDRRRTKKEGMHNNNLARQRGIRDV